MSNNSSNIVHLLVEEKSNLQNYLQNKLNLDSAYIQYLLHMGAIYLNKSRLYEFPEFIFTGDYLRCHIRPKKYLQINNWDDYVIDSNEYFIVINKPAGLPVHEMLDNRIENAQYNTEKLYNIKLFTLNRVDIDTRGIVLFAKNSNIAKLFNQLIQVDKVYKEYLCFTKEKVPTGPMLHYMQKSKASPKVLNSSYFEDSLECKLEVLSSSPISENLQSKFATEKCFLSKIKLITGRTHQIRCQLSYENHPLLGDSIYNGPPSAFLGLIANRIKFKFLDKDFDYQLFDD